MYHLDRKRAGYPMKRKAYRSRYLRQPHALSDALLLKQLTQIVYRGVVRGGL